MGKEENIEGYVLKVQKLVHLMKACGETLTNRMIVNKHCWDRKDNGSTKSKEEGENLARQDSNDSDDMVVMDAVANDHIESKIWFLDSGFSNHMTSKKIWLVDFDESKKIKVKFADNNSFQVEGIENIVIQMSNGAKALLKYVLHVPGIKCNLLVLDNWSKRGS
ncbi:uncharacterized protein LOC127080820 [Lathyrus oleraceus]|uniref:uncharacterized protein LOC127080820 n=1 Tax=Pisum sativum TaxID=3888 RepID=UPI0021CF797A|nr:uncharacterized protein LOC127080820 [Pisum sativum]